MRLAFFVLATAFLILLSFCISTSQAFVYFCSSQRSFLSWKAGDSVLNGYSKSRSFHPQQKMQFNRQQLKMIGKLFEEKGPLGKGITVGKIQVSLAANDRTSPTSIFSLLERQASNNDSSPEELARMANEICLSLLRKRDDWTGACSSSKWFPMKDSGKAESYFNDLSNTEAAKFEKEYNLGSSGSDSKEISGVLATQVVVSLVLEIQGDSTKFDGAGFSLSGTKDVLSSIASNVLVDGGDCVNAAEVFWTPSDRDEVLTKNDIILDFPELVDL